jgi:hypothetical protein
MNHRTHTDHITIGRNPVLTYEILAAIARRRNHPTFAQRVRGWVGKVGTFFSRKEGKLTP